MRAGATLAVPEGYTGAVLRQSDAGGEEGGPAWRADARFSSVSYWNHDTHPAKTDGARRCFEFLSLAKAVRSLRLLCPRPSASGRTLPGIIRPL